MILPCEVQANPEATVTWEREAVEMPVNRTVKVPIGLAIDTVQVQDTLVNVYVALPVFTRIAGTSYAYFLE